MLFNDKNLKWSKIGFNCLLIYLLGFFIISINIFLLARDLPSLDELQKFNPQQVSKIISADGTVINKLYTHKRDMVTIGAIPPHLRNALFAMEDRIYKTHEATDSFRRSFYGNNSKRRDKGGIKKR